MAHVRQSSNFVTLSLNGLFITLMAKDYTVSKSYLYSIKKKILNNQIRIPSVSERTQGSAPYLLGYCSKELANGVEFLWN